MKLNIRTIVGISLGVVLITSTVILMIVFIPQRPKLREHVAIVIWGDEDFKNYDFEGEGTKEDPYLIQYLNITTERNYGIFIKDTTVYFQIQNCYIDASRVGIYIAEARSGTFKLVENTITKSWAGIEIFNSDNAFLLRNNCSFNPVCVEFTPQLLAGIILQYSYNTKLIDNICNENAYYGILIKNSNSTTFINNTCNQNQIYGIRAFASPNSIFINNTCNSNVNSCYWYTNETYNNGMFISSSENSTIVGNTCINNTNTGISLWHSLNSEMRNNFCENNSDYGLHILYSNNTEITNNRCRLNSYGIFLSETYNCSLTYNVLEENEFYGINLDVQSGNNSVHHNNFKENNIAGISQAYDVGVENIWYDDVALEGNYWDNWVGIGTYAIDGSANSVDLFPLDYEPFLSVIQVKFV